MKIFAITGSKFAIERVEKCRKNDDQSRDRAKQALDSQDRKLKKEKRLRGWVSK